MVPSCSSSRRPAGRRRTGDAHPRRHRRRHRLRRPGTGPPARPPSRGHADRGDVVRRHQRAAAAAGAHAHLGRRGGAARRRPAGRDADVVFLALPEAASAEVGAALLERGVRVIDLSGAFRIRERRRSPALVSGDDGAARRASSTGCRSGTPTAIREATARVLSRAAIRPRRCSRSSRWRRLACSRARSSSTRSRASPAPARRRPIGRTSPRTTAASRRTASSRTGTRRRSSRSSDATVTFVPHLVPLDRGILETIYVSLRRARPRRRWPRRCSAHTPSRRSSA